MQSKETTADKHQHKILYHNSEKAEAKETDVVTETMKTIMKTTAERILGIMTTTIEAKIVIM